MSDSLTTRQAGYLLLRTEADEDAAAIDLAADGGGWDNRPSGIVRLPTGRDGDSYVNAIQIAFAGGIDAGTDPDNKTFSWKLYAWKDDECPAEYVADGTGTIGTQDVVKFPDRTVVVSTALRQWADTLVISNQRFVRTVSSTDATGNNEISKLVVDSSGYKYWFVEISSADGVTGTEAGAISAWLTYF